MVNIFNQKPTNFLERNILFYGEMFVDQLSRIEKVLNSMNTIMRENAEDCWDDDFDDEKEEESVARK